VSALSGTGGSSTTRPEEDGASSSAAAEDAGAERVDPPLAIADHGLIGDLRTAALVGTDGTIDWFCPERFDAPSVFGALLDPDGGCWRIWPTCDVSSTGQFYFPDSNVLITRFLTENGVVEVQDFMPLHRSTGTGGSSASDDDGRRVEHRQRIVRRVVCVRGRMSLSTTVAPRFDYARGAHEVVEDEHGARFVDGTIELALGSSVPLELGERDVTAEFSLEEREEATFVLHVVERDGRGDGTDPGRDATDAGSDGDDRGRAADSPSRPAAHRPEDAARLFRHTVDFWRDWLASSTYTGRWREMIHRSALTLKLLTYEPTGAIIAAPTAALPEELGGERNWDYRYVWMRDAAFTIYALIRLGFTAEAEAFMGWLADRFCATDGMDDGELPESGPLQTMYRVDGDPQMEEEELGHLAGYAGSRPVRIGNGAATQLQLDIYGELIDSVYLFDKYGTPISWDTWQDLTRVVEWVCDHWDQPDEGIWETRGGRQDHVFSRLMCWVAIERMVRMARQRGLPADLARWTSVRDEIYRQVMDRGFKADKGEDGAFVQHYDDEVLDASVLLMPMVKFCSPTDPRFLSTLDAIQDHLVSDSLVHRYDPEASPDGAEGGEGTFSICSFWYVEALTRAGRLEDARLALEKMFTYANHLGLYAEEISLTGEQLGNFPQAFTHFSLISAAYNLDRAMG
jgi:GH15 family glucan-1,4-alpha-glucosidase